MNTLEMNTGLLQLIYCRKGSVVAHSEIRGCEITTSLFSVLAWLFQRDGGASLYARTRHANQHESNHDKAVI